MVKCQEIFQWALNNCGACEFCANREHHGHVPRPLLIDGRKTPADHWPFRDDFAQPCRLSRAKFRLSSSRYAWKNIALDGDPDGRNKTVLAAARRRDVHA